MHKSRILEETTRRREVEGLTGEALPDPSYLFVSRYGRNLAADFEELKEIGGYRDGFIFRVKGEEEVRNPVHRFQMEAEAHTRLGRKLQGLVLVDLGGGSGSMEKQEWKGLFLYLKNLEPDVHFIFNVEKNEDTEQVQELLKRYFFIRTVEGEAYDAEEALEIIREAFRRFRFRLEPESEKVFLDALSEYTWSEEEHVENQLQNLVKNAIYDAMLKMDGETDESAKIIDENDAREIVRGLEDNTEQKHVIGFY